MISIDPGLIFIVGSCFFSSNVISLIIFSILFSISNDQIVDKINSTELAF